MAILATGASPYVQSNTDFEDITTGGAAGPSGSSIDIYFNDDAGTNSADVIASLERGRSILIQYYDSIRG